ncbi:unnamed product [Ostreococcus tauri]|uniref:Unnamed product n=1 Tax=Ostreococcus tauri TaxID=70448 RepID=A0A090M4P8_OSTTA|nr:unnamed product [Ostreococcus tauri]CEF99166.1 unnamed product [Ostreococcus tauri]|eukprot:XP_003081344.2 unnamed product [Ostreococcus tauri]
MADATVDDATTRGRWASDRDCELAETSSLLRGDDGARAEGSRDRRGVTVGTIASGALALAACAALGVWTHKSKTLQEAWRPVPGAEMLERGGGVDSGIARWRAREVASLGGAETLTGVTPTPSQMTALRALRLQIRNAMFNGGEVSAGTVKMLTMQFLNVIPQAAATFPSGTAANVDELDGAVKQLMSRGVLAAPASPSAESEFREMIPASPRPTVEQAMEESTQVDAARAPQNAALPPRKPLTTYESALFETKAAANAVASTGAGAGRKHKSGRTSSEAQTVAQNDKWEAMINSLDSSGRVIKNAASRQLDDNNIFNRLSSPSPSETDDFVQYENEAPRRERQQSSPIVESEVEVEAPQPTSQASAPQDPPWAKQPQQLQEPTVTETATPTSSTADDSSWTDFQELMEAEPSPSPAPEPAPEPEPVPEPAPEPVPDVPSQAAQPDPVDVMEALDFGSTDRPQVGEQEIATPQAAATSDDDDMLKDMLRDGGDKADTETKAETKTESEQATSVLGDDTAKSPLFKPVIPNANVEAIASNIIDMIMAKKSSSGDAAAVGLDENGNSGVAPRLSKEAIAAQLAESLTALTSDSIEKTATESARMVDEANDDPNAKIMADALVAHDHDVAARIAQILSGGKSSGSQVAGIGATSGSGDGASQLIMYEEQRRQREEIEAMRRDLAALMANVQANYAMGVAHDRIDKTAASAAARIIDVLRPTLASDAVAREGASEVFDYPIMPSSSLSSETLRLDAGSDARPKKTTDESKKSDATADSDDDEFDYIEKTDAGAEDSSAKLSKSESTSNAGDSVETSNGGGSSSEPSWLTNALTDEQLTAQFVADETEADGDHIKKSTKKKSKHSEARLGAVPGAFASHKPTGDDVQGSYIQALNERAERALRSKPRS